MVTLVVACFAAAMPARAKEVYTQRENTQMREGPGSFYPLVGVLPAGKKVSVLKEEGRWVQIKADKEGWISSNALLPMPPKESGPGIKKFTSSEASRAGVAAAIRGYGARFGKTREGNIDEFLAGAASAFTPSEYLEFRRSMLAALPAGFWGRPLGGVPSDRAYAVGEAEQGVGVGMAARIAATRGLVKDPELVRYLNLVGTWVAEQGSAYDWDFRFFVLADDRVNAFAVPGGFIFVTRGAIAFCNDEAELAGLLAHEIAHVAMRHGLKEMKARKERMHADSAMAELEEMAGPTEHDDAVEDLNEFADQAYEIVHKPRTMQAEMEADLIGTWFLWRAGYGADGLMRLLGRTAQMKEQKDFFSSEITTRELAAERHQKLSAAVRQTFAPYSLKSRFEERFRSRVR